MHPPTCFPHSPHILSQSLSHYSVFVTLSFSELFVSMFIVCLSPLECKLQEGKSFVLLTTISLALEESTSASRYAYQMSVELLYVHVNKYGYVQNDSGGCSFSIRLQHRAPALTLDSRQVSRICGHSQQCQISLGAGILGSYTMLLYSI